MNSLKNKLSKKLKYFFCVLIITQPLLSCRQESSSYENIHKSDTVRVASVQPPAFNFLAKDIQIGTPLNPAELKHYNYYGQFEDGAFLDFYIADYPGFTFLSESPSNIILEYRDGILIQKRYRFDRDIFATIHEHYLKRQKITIGNEPKIINLHFKNKRLIYHRKTPYLLYETIKKETL